MKLKPLCALPCALYGIVHLTAADAQESRARASILEEVIVTAQKRSESVQDIPVAVTALTADTRQLLGVNSIEDLTNFVPGLTYEGQLDRASIRGVGRVMNAPGTDPGVGLYVDGVYNSSSTIAGRSTIFTDRVEVLRGPQGSLYGRNTTGGAINTISRGANDSFGGEVQLTYGDYDRKVFDATVTGPITDWMRFRLTGSLTKQDKGYFRNLSGVGARYEGDVKDNQDFEGLLEMDLGESVDLSLRLTYRDTWQLDRFSASFTQPTYSTTTFINGCPSAVTFSFLRSGCIPSALFNGTVPTTTLGSIPASDVWAEGNPASNENRRIFVSNIPTLRETNDSIGISPTLTWHMPFMQADLKWIGGYNEYTYASLSDFDGFGVSLSRESYLYTPPAVAGAGQPVRVFTGQHLRFAEDKEYYSNDLQLISTGDGAITYVFGLYQYHEEYEQIPIAQGFVNPDQPELFTVYQRPATLPSTVAHYNAMTQVAYQNPLGEYASLRGFVEVDSYAGYGQVDWKLSDHWKVAIGGRYSRDEKWGYETRRTIVWNPTIAGASAKAFDNSPTGDCYVPDGQQSSANPAYDLVIDRNTGQEVAPPTATGSYTNACGRREFEKRTWSKFTPSAIVEWRPMDDFLTYAKYSMGYKAGAIRVANMDIDSQTDPETVDAFEVGAKVTLADRYQFNLAAFYYDYTDYQFPVTRVFPQPDGTNSTVREYANIDAKSSGVEIEAALQPLDSLSIRLSYSYLDTETTSDLYLLDTGDVLALNDESTYPDVRAVPVANCTPSTDGENSSSNSRNNAGGTGNATGFEAQPCYQYYQNVKGGELPNSPKHKANGSIAYTFDFGVGTLTPAFAYSWRGSRTSAGLGISPLARRRNSTPSYGIGDATITWIDALGRYRIIAGANNVFDDQTANSVGVASNDVNTRILNLNPPRTWYLTFQYNFGSEVR